MQALRMGYMLMVCFWKEHGGIGKGTPTIQNKNFFHKKTEPSKDILEIFVS